MSNRRLLVGFHPDSVFDALAHEYRRLALSRLAENDEGMPLHELAEQIAMETVPHGNVRNDERIGRIAVRLHHVHLPKLAAAGFVAFVGGDSRMADLTSAGSKLESLHSDGPFATLEDAD